MKQIRHNEFDGLHTVTRFLLGYGTLIATGLSKQEALHNLLKRTQQFKSSLSNIQDEIDEELKNDRINSKIHSN